jgi:hypothetical protein
MTLPTKVSLATHGGLLRGWGDWLATRPEIEGRGNRAPGLPGPDGSADVVDQEEHQDHDGDCCDESHVRLHTGRVTAPR